jgi:hypothetical protein
LAEPRPLQRFIMLGASVGFIALLVVPALDFRFGWSIVPLGGVVVAYFLFALGFGRIGQVYRANTFTSATIAVAPVQQVISTGPYAIPRHPVYASALPASSERRLLWAHAGGSSRCRVCYRFDLAAPGRGALLGTRATRLQTIQRRVLFRLIPGVW